MYKRVQDLVEGDRLSIDGVTCTVESVDLPEEYDWAVIRCKEGYSLKNYKKLNSVLMADDHVDVDLRRALEAVTIDCRNNGLSLPCCAWTRVKDAVEETYIKFSGTTMVEYNHVTRVVSTWGRVRYDYYKVPV